MKVVSPFSANRVTQAIDDEQFSNLVGDIYDAALDQSLWVPVLEKCVSFVGGCGAALFFKTPRPMAATLISIPASPHISGNSISTNMSRSIPPPPDISSPRSSSRSR